MSDDKEEKKPFRLGDVVVLKCAIGIPMSIIGGDHHVDPPEPLEADEALTEVFDRENNNEDGDSLIDVCWFNKDNELQEGSFPPEALKHY